jgi:putative ABC transport system substrate-binding protein
VKRRDFITLLGGAAAAWPIMARAQQVRRIGALAIEPESDPGSRKGWAALREGLAKLGWIEGRNLRTEYRLGSGDLDRIRSDAAELVGLALDVIVVSGGVAVRAVQRETQTIPIVFTQGGDPAATGLVRDIARPEGNTTGFSAVEPSIAGKWLALLKEAAPQVTRVAVLFNPEISQTGLSYIASIEAAAPALMVEVMKAPVHDAVDIVRALDAFAAMPNGGLLVLPPLPTGANLNAILRLAMQHRLPAVYPNGEPLAAAGGLISYGADTLDRYRRAASYVDRLLRGAKVADLPVQFPTKFDLAINLKTAKAIGLSLPPALLARADEVIE